MLRQFLLAALLGLFLNGCAAHERDGHRYSHHEHDGAYYHRAGDDQRAHRYAEHREVPRYNGRWEDRHRHYEQRGDWNRAPIHKDKRGGFSTWRKNDRDEERHRDGRRTHDHDHSHRRWDHDRDYWRD